MQKKTGSLATHGENPSPSEYRPSILVSAFGIHGGGGLVLLKALIKSLHAHLKAAAIDSRADLGEFVATPCPRIRYVRRSFLARISSLSKLAAMTSSQDVLFCFNSLPPLRKPKGKVVNYVQAPHFVGGHRGIVYSRLTTMRQIIERIWFRLGIHNCDEIWVQTRSMAEAIQRVEPRAIIRIVPFVDDVLLNRLRAIATVDKRAVSDGSHVSFIYPADAVGHKNHENLLRAWELLQGEGRFPRLFLTLEPDEWIAVSHRAQLNGYELLNIENLGRLSRDEVLQFISQCSALIFPSKAETLGLPMLEAYALGIPIVASERDFVRDVCLPDQTFDPNSARSIAMAVVRFIDGAYPPASRYYSADEVVDKLVS